MEKHRYGLTVLNQLIVRDLLCRLKHNDFVINWWLSIKLESSTEKENDRQFFYSNYLERHKICHAWFFGSKKRYGLLIFCLALMIIAMTNVFCSHHHVPKERKVIYRFFFRSTHHGALVMSGRLQSWTQSVPMLTFFFQLFLNQVRETKSSNPSLISRFQLASDATSESNE